MSQPASRGSDAALDSLRHAFRAPAHRRAREALVALRPTLATLRSGEMLARMRGLPPTARERGEIAGCGYCGSALAIGSGNCDNCGAAASAPVAGAAPPSMALRLSSLALWYAGGFFGIHCFAAGRPLRGVIYLTGIFIVLATLLSFDPSSGTVGLGGNGTMLVGIGLGVLWVCDGVQILRGRFA